MTWLEVSRQYLGFMAFVYNLGVWKDEVGDGHKFESSLGYVVLSRPASASEWDPASELFFL